MKRALILIAIILAAAVLILQLLHAQKTTPIPAPTQVLEWFGENVTLLERNKTGQLTRTIFAQTLQHYTPDNYTDLSQVKLSIFPVNKGDRHWELTSDKGRLFHGDHREDIVRIDLWHNVVLFSPATEKESAVTIKTSSIAIFPDKEYAHSNQYTTIDQVGQKMSGIGMEVFFNTQTFRLIDKVSSVHENTN